MMTYLWVWLFFASASMVALRINKQTLAMSLLISIFWFYIAPVVLFMKLYKE